MKSRASRAVLFDMDGVLVDSYEAWFHLMNQAAEDMGYRPISRERYAGMWGQSLELDVERVYTRHTVQDVEDYYRRRFGDCTGYMRANPSAQEVFTALRREGVGVAVITNTPSPMARGVLDHVALHPDVLVGGTDVPRAKPAPDMVLKAVEALGVSTAQALLVGDSPSDREAAAAARVPFLQYDIRTDASLGVVLETFSG